MMGSGVVGISESAIELRSSFGMSAVNQQPDARHFSSTGSRLPVLRHSGWPFESTSIDAPS
jgi:hypothetical protein